MFPSLVMNFVEPAARFAGVEIGVLKSWLMLMCGGDINQVELFTIYADIKFASDIERFHLSL